MDSSIGKMVYCSISKGSKIVYSYNRGDPDIESLAARCLEKAPAFHSQYFHTAGKRTFGFLIENEFVYFVIVDPNSSNLTALRLLEEIRDSFKKNGEINDLVPHIKRLINSLECMNNAAIDNSISNSTMSVDGTSSTKAPLLGKSGSSKKKVKDGEVMKIDVASDSAAMAVSSNGERTLPKSFNARARGQQGGRKLWWRHFKIVVAVDVFVCLVMFGIWLAVCRGFQCVS